MIVKLNQPPGSRALRKLMSFAGSWMSAGRLMMRSTLAALMRKEPQKNSGCLPLHPFRPHGSSKAAGAGPPAPGPARTTPSRSSRRRQSRWFSRRARAAAGPHARDNLKSHPVLFQDHTRRRFLLHGRRRSSRFISLYRFSSLLQVARLHRPPQRPQQRRRRLPRRRHRHSDRNQGCGNPPLTLKKKPRTLPVQTSWHGSSGGI